MPCPPRLGKAWNFLSRSYSSSRLCWGWSMLACCSLESLESSRWHEILPCLYLSPFSPCMLQLWMLTSAFPSKGCVVFITVYSAGTFFRERESASPDLWSYECALGYAFSLAVCVCVWRALWAELLCCAELLPWCGEEGFSVEIWDSGGPEKKKNT